MNDFLNNLFNSLGTFYNEMMAKGTQWWIILVCLIMTWLLVIIASKVIRNTNKLSTYFKIYKSGIIGASIIGLILVSTYCYLYGSTNFYYQSGEELIHLLSLIVILFLAANLLHRLSKGFAQGARDIIVQPYTKGEHREFLLKAQSEFKKVKIWMLLPLLGFLALLIGGKPANLVSIVMDNSKSMTGVLEDGKQALGTTISDLNDETDIVLSWLTDVKPKRKINELMKVSDPSQLEGQHQFFEDKFQAIDYLETAGTIASSPLLEAMWSNYLFSASQQQALSYERKLLVLITDGDESYMAEDLQNFFCSVTDFDDFFDEISVINLGTSYDNGFFRKASECGYSIDYDGTSLSTYSSSLNEILGQFKSDYLFVIWMAIISVLLIFSSILFIQPKKG